MNKFSYKHQKKRISYGIILIKIPPFYINFSDFRFTTSNGICINEEITDIEKFSMFANEIYFLMIRQKHSYDYGAFIRGKYSLDKYKAIESMFRQMTQSEINSIINNDNFDELWKLYWNSDNIIDYSNAKDKFIKFKSTKDNDILYTDLLKKVKPKYDSTEWGFPKGGKNENETEIECAIREFKEETNIDLSIDNVIPNVKLDETLIGTDGCRYSYKYFVALTTENINPIIDVNNLHQTIEIGDIRFMNYDDAYRNIRSFMVGRKLIILSLFNYIIRKLSEYAYFPIDKLNNDPEVISREIIYDIIRNITMQ